MIPIFRILSVFRTYIFEREICVKLLRFLWGEEL